MTDKEYISEKIATGDRRSHNEIAADLQLFRWNNRLGGNSSWRFPEDRFKKEKQMEDFDKIETNDQEKESS